MKKKLEKLFFEKFGYECDDVYFSPSRINLIGEHIDYNGGKVFPCAITIGTYAAVKKRDDEIFNLYSVNLEEGDEFKLSDINIKNNNWCDYVRGMLVEILNAGYKVSGMDILVYGNIPNGAGLSSSASLEMLIGYIQNDLANNLKIDSVEMAIMGKNTENNYIGVSSGIMDQFAVNMGKKDRAIILDTSNLEYDLLPVSFDDAGLLIMNTNKRRTLVDSKYNERVNECSIALEVLKTKYNIENLSKIEEKSLNEIEKLLDNVVFRRVRHIVTENKRVKEFISACKERNSTLAGELLTASHNSLKDDYEVTGRELDTIVYLANQQDGCFGARMTGAGFGGCAIALVKYDCVDNFIKEVSKKYSEIIGYNPEIIYVNIGDAPHKL